MLGPFGKILHCDPVHMPPPKLQPITDDPHIPEITRQQKLEVQINDFYNFVDWEFCRRAQKVWIASTKRIHVDDLYLTEILTRISLNNTPQRILAIHQVLYFSQGSYSQIQTEPFNTGLFNRMITNNLRIYALGAVQIIYSAFVKSIACYIKFTDFEYKSYDQTLDFIRLELTELMIILFNLICVCEGERGFSDIFVGLKPYPPKYLFRQMLTVTGGSRPNFPVKKMLMIILKSVTLVTGNETKNFCTRDNKGGGTRQEADISLKSSLRDYCNYFDRCSERYPSIILPEPLQFISGATQQMIDSIKSSRTRKVETPILFESDELMPRSFQDALDIFARLTKHTKNPPNNGNLTDLMVSST